jgi:energy-coupling factor transporter ATP-binding protein EcfA2
MNANGNVIKRLVQFGAFRLVIWVGEGCLYVCKQTSALSLHIFTALERGLKCYARIVDREIWGETVNPIVQMQAALEPAATVEALTDIVEAIKGKQVVILGETGAGKSTIAQYLAYAIGGQVAVYEPEGTPDDWLGLEVIGEGENWFAIANAMQYDLDDLTSQIQLRKEKGQAALAGSDRVLICEEFPEVISQVDCASEWMERHARRGRKSHRFVILLSQSSRVKALGLEGKGDLIECFKIIRLGKHAIEHAKRLHKPELITWLHQDKGHCLIDDEPLILPSYAEMKRTIPTFLPSTREGYRKERGSACGVESEGLPAEPSEPSINQQRAEILEALEEGRTDHWICSNILKVTGGSRYAKAKSEIAKIRELKEAN